MIYAERISEFSLGLGIEDIPQELLQRVKGSILDTLGVCLAATQLDFSAMMTEYALDLGGPERASIIGHRQRVHSAHAALVNGSLAHCLDFDDSHGPSRTHPSSCTVPAALALGEELGSSGQDILVATVAGLEVMLRLAMAGVSRATADGYTEGFHQRGIHPTILCGVFGATTIAARLLALDIQKCGWALGLAGGMASGSFEYLTEGTWGKRIGPGWAAHSALAAAKLAAKGISGPRTIFEGKAGLYRSRLREGHFDLEQLVEALGLQWQALSIGIKRYPCCHRNHAQVQLALMLKKQYGLKMQDIHSVKCTVDRLAVPLVCEPWNDKLQPGTGYAAKFSLPFCISAALVKGSLPMTQFEGEALYDTEVRALMNKVSYRVDETLDPREWPGRLKIYLHDGRILEAEKIKDDYAQWPEIVEKFNEYASPVIGDSAAASVVSSIADLENLPNIHAVMRLLRAGG